MLKQYECFYCSCFKSLWCSEACIVKNNLYPLDNVQRHENITMYCLAVCGGGSSISRVAVPTPKGAPTYYLTKFRWKLHENEENWKEWASNTTRLQEGNVFTPVCHSVHGGGGWTGWAHVPGIPLDPPMH